MTHDPSQHLSTVDFNEALLVLHKVTVQKDIMEPSEVTNFLSPTCSDSPRTDRGRKGRQTIQHASAVQRGDPAELHNAAVIGCAEGLCEFRLASIP